MILVTLRRLQDYPDQVITLVAFDTCFAGCVGHLTATIPSPEAVLYPSTDEAIAVSSFVAWVPADWFHVPQNKKTLWSTFGDKYPCATQGIASISDPESEID